ncbi:MAG: hypothetical protein AABX11_00850 [Nanoarchaeota archaeon]
MKLEYGFMFWLGIAVLSLVNIIFNMLNKNTEMYNKWIFGVSIIILIIYGVILIWRRK